MDKLEMMMQMILDPMTLLWAKFSSMVPNLLAAIVMLVVGYVLARLVKLVVRKVLDKLGVDALSERLKISECLRKMNISASVSDLFGTLAFLFIMLAFILSAVETLGFERVSTSIDQLLFYLPKVFGAAIVLMAGLFIADLVRTGVRNVSESVGLDYAPALSKLSFGLVVVVAAMLAIDQLDIDIFLLSELVGIVFISVGVAVALSLGLGSRDISRHIVSGVYMRDLYQSGDTIEVGENTGTVIEVGTVKTMIKLKGGSELSLSNGSLLNQAVVIHKKK